LTKLLLAFLFIAAGQRASAEALQPKQTWAVVSGVLAWQDHDLASFPKEHRKDQELFEQLGAMGVPIAQRRLLIDEQATTENILAAIHDAVARAPSGATLIVYYAGHGLKDSRGDVVFASVDVSSKRPDETGLHLADLVPILQRFKGKRLILMADCCYSGGLVSVAAALKGDVVTLTSAEASNTSTGNWTFTQVVIDALQGKALEDRDGDGKIELGELAAEIADAMKYREQQRAAFTTRGVSRHLVLARAVRGPHASGWVQAPQPGHDDLVPARILGARGEGGERELHVGYYDYSDDSDAWVAEGATRPFVFKTWPVGTKLTVMSEKIPTEATVLATADGFMKVTYTGWDTRWDEWVTVASVVKAPDDQARTLQVEWQGTWYDAVETGVNGELTCIHYVGYDDSWNECVVPARVR